MGILVGGGFSVSNYLQGVMGPRGNGNLILAGEISKIYQAQAWGITRSVLIFPASSAQITNEIPRPTFLIITLNVHS